MKPTLIIAEDVPLVRERLHVTLQEDFEILEGVADGLKAVEACVRYAPDLVLMDVVMPCLSGIEAIRLIHEKMPKPPKILVLSGLKDEQAILHALEAGAADFLQKPIDEKRLKEVLWGLLSEEEDE